eukprot:5232229-Pleurochrysis_carterae.AAC.4
MDTSEGSDDDAGSNFLETIHSERHQQQADRLELDTNKLESSMRIEVLLVQLVLAPGTMARMLLSAVIVRYGAENMITYSFSAGANAIGKRIALHLPLL